MVNEACSKGHWVFWGTQLRYRGPTTSYDSPKSAGAIYLFDVAARSTRKHRGIRPSIVIWSFMWLVKLGAMLFKLQRVCDDGLGSTTKGLAHFLLVMTMGMIIKCPPIWLVTISIIWCCCTHNNWTQFPFVVVLHLSLVILHLSMS